MKTTQVRKNIDLDSEVVERLQAEADRQKRPLKLHIEYLLSEHSKRVK